LDYVRYDGKNPDIVNEQLITDFVKQTRDITKNKGLELSVCLMPEKDQSKKLYGQNTKELSQYCDVIMPMIYKGNYNKNTDWIKETTQYYKDNSDCKVAPIILTYKSDKDTTKLSLEELKTDIKAVYDGGADGCSLFKYGYVDVIL
jgi:spore germination protein YaaH